MSGNNSFFNNSQSSPGFVYFNTNSPSTSQSQTAQNTANTSGFLAFSESPQSKQFCPSSYSSPQKSYQSPRHFSPHQKNWKQNRYSGGQNRYSGGQNRYSGGQNYNKRQTWGNRSNSFQKSFGDDDDISRYLHPSFTEDPWAELEKQLESASNSSKADEVDTGN